SSACRLRSVFAVRSEDLSPKVRVGREISDGGRQALRVIPEQAQPRVARGAQNASHRPGGVVVVYRVLLAVRRGGSAAYVALSRPQMAHGGGVEPVLGCVPHGAGVRALSAPGSGRTRTTCRAERLSALADPHIGQRTQPGFTQFGRPPLSLAPDVRLLLLDPPVDLFAQCTNAG